MSSRVDPRHESDHDAHEQPLALMNQPAQSDAPPLNTVLGEMSASTNLLKSPVLNEPLPKESLLPVQFEQLEKLKLLEEGKCLSESMLWKIQEDFYIQQGVSAWDDGVPFFVTNSVFIAESYAELIISFLRDYADNLDNDEPVYIVEMASGTGRFGFYLIQELNRKKQAFQQTQDLDIQVVLTDFTEQNIEFWESHPEFQSLLDKACVDFAVFTPEQDETIHLRRSGTVLSAETVKNPMIATANYFFDTIRTDIFRVESKTLHDLSLRIFQAVDDSPSAEEKPLVIEDVRLEMRFNPVTHKKIYDHPKWDAILDEYRHEVPKGEILFPIGGLRCLENLQKMSPRGIVFISSDKAYTTTEAMLALPHHGYSVHGGAFSYMVNFDAVGRYFKNEGGHYFQTTGRSHAVQTVCCIAVEEEQPCAYENVAYIYNEKLNRTNSINSMNDSQCIIRQGATTTGPTLESLLAYLRMSYCDPKAFSNATPKIIDLMMREKPSHEKQLDLMRMMDEAWENYYHFKGEVNLPFWLGQLHYYLENYERSVEFFKHTCELFGEHAALHFLMGQSYERMKKKDKAIACYKRSLEMNPDMAEAEDALRNLGGMA